RRPLPLLAAADLPAVGVRAHPPAVQLRPRDRAARRGGEHGVARARAALRQPPGARVVRKEPMAMNANRSRGIEHRSRACGRRVAARALAGLAAVLVSLTSAAHATAQETAPLRVCATTPDLGALVREIGGDDVAVT